VSRARNRTVSLHYESTGAGAAVLLVMGLGMNATGWWRTVPVLAAAGLRVLTFDNRGVGRSDRPLGPYTTAVMADDAVAVLDAVGVQRAHVYGISLGGMIAQEIALRHPDRIARLVLGATTPGGDGAIPADGQTLEFFQRRGQMPAEEAVWASVPYNYSARTRAQHGDRIVQDIRQRLRFPIEPDPYAAQLAAALGHDAHDRLARIAAATLVVHGEEDVMVPPANGRLLANLILDARLLELGGAAHLYPTDEPDADREIAAFLTGRED
jgi:pimeloyl-ACP methyl ester carboxylesterase